jgi:hypothetical protein
LRGIRLGLTVNKSPGAEVGRFDFVVFVSVVAASWTISAAALEIVVEPDDFADGAEISGAVPGVTLSIEGHPGEAVRSRDGTLNSGPTSGTNNAPTGDRVFGHDFQCCFDPATDFRTIWTQLENSPILRADFASPANSVSIQAFANDDDTFQLEAYDRSGVRLTSDNTGEIRGTTATLTVSTAGFDIAYVLAFGVAPEGGGQLDDLRANVRDPFEVSIDIQPQNERRCLNQKKVEVYGSSDFDVSQVRLDALVFGDNVPDGKVPLCRLGYFNEDEFQDLSCSFVPGTAVATLAGEMLDGTTFTGSDTICAVQ